MSTFEYSNADQHKARMLRTRALIAALHARHLSGSTDGPTWTFIAERWAELADIAHRNIRWPIRPSV
jgi:hypothetical protein